MMETSSEWYENILWRREIILETQRIKKIFFYTKKKEADNNECTWD